MCDVMSVIEEKYQMELKELFAEGEKHVVGHRMKEIWNDDRMMMQKNIRGIRARIVSFILFDKVIIKHFRDWKEEQSLECHYN